MRITGALTDAGIDQAGTIRSRGQKMNEVQTRRVSDALFISHDVSLRRQTFINLRRVCPRLEDG